jgi:predicted dehydrogenase
MRAAVIGAGSIGNHLTYSARKFDWKVSVFDKDPEALRRFKEDIYPSRYGKQDPEIELLESDEMSRFKAGDFDAVLIGTPPDSHLSVLRQIIKLSPKLVLIEKPICPPSEAEIYSLKQIFEENANTTFLAGYNHRLSLVTQQLVHTVRAFEYSIQKLDVDWLESWNGILRAHPWINGPGDTYLGSTLRGGGALFEHSHGLDLWLQLAQVFKLGGPASVRAEMQMKTIPAISSSYDELSSVEITTSTGFKGQVRQDVKTDPAAKRVLVQGARFSYLAEYGKNSKDCFTLAPTRDQLGALQVEVKKDRPSDFDPEIALINHHINSSSPSDIPLGLGALSALVTAYVGKSAIESAEQQREILIDLSEWSELRNA